MTNPTLADNPAPIDAPSESASRAQMLGLAAAILLVGINMRPAIVAVSPLLDVIRTSTGMSNTAAGTLTTLPLVCFGVFAPLAPRFGRRFGMEATLVGVLLILLAGIAIRLAPTLIALWTMRF